MARIGVLESQQDPSDKPKRYVKKCVADGLVRKLLAKRISNKTIQMVVIRKALALLESAPEVIHIPQLLPPRGPEGLLLTYPLPDQRTVYV